MTQNLRRVSAGGANPREFEADELSEPTLQNADDYYEIYAVQGDTTTAFGAGFGPQNAQYNADGWADLDLQNGGGSAINGKVRFRIYRDSSKDDLIAQSGTYSLSGLRSAVAADRTDKVLIPALHNKLAGNDSFLTVEVKPKSTSTGDDVSAANSNTELGLPYSEVRT